ncbi:hypothetical protein FDP41_005888 [Naegleria fowleri]|uniref:ADP-ribosylation factor-like protein 6 n=1 Tax=Naegleria fowleri TaxID=5763 RepID=A0A6A5BNH6_NAEFO|nr:uncharacterized protein FDP41_005888 [Naegleria fowleri]KAF0975135.1 hypothetical protein FDP41_005888 [Naegleria fowleri]
MVNILQKLGLRKKKLNLIVCGLENSGKSSIISHLKPSSEKKENVLPTAGYKLEEFSRNGYLCRVFDLSGAGKYRPMWKYFFENLEGIIFVVDVSDTKRLCVARDELLDLVSNKELAGVPVLVCANKIDVDKKKVSLAQIHNILSLDGSNREWKIEGTSAKEGTGIEEAFSWLVNSAATFVSKKKEAQKQILISSVSQTVTHHHGV